MKDSVKPIEAKVFSLAHAAVVSGDIQDMSNDNRDTDLN